MIVKIGPLIVSKLANIRLKNTTRDANETHTEVCRHARYKEHVLYPVNFVTGADNYNH